MPICKITYCKELIKVIETLIRVYGGMEYILANRIR